MLMAEECRLGFFDNSASERRRALIGRRRGRVVASMKTRASNGLILSDRPAAANEAVVRRHRNGAIPRTMSTAARVELRLSYSRPQAKGSTRRRKKDQNKPTVDMRNVLFDRRNNMFNNGLSARHRTMGAKPLALASSPGRSFSACWPGCLARSQRPAQSRRQSARPDGGSGVSIEGRVSCHLLGSTTRVTSARSGRPAANHRARESETDPFLPLPASTHD